MERQYDFTSILDRHGKDALAVDGVGLMPGFTPEPPEEGFDLIPMWVADMNFATVPTIQEAIIRRVQHPCFGYFQPTKEYYEAIIHWQESHNGVQGLQAADISYENGVLGGVVSALDVLCARGSYVLLNSPAYIGFTGTLENCGYRADLSPLVQDEEGIWRLDLEDMERRIRSHHIHCAIFCSPHNPTGRVWEREELEAVYALFAKYDVQVISDEIWSDILLGERVHIPLQSISEDARMRTAAFYAPSKTFNLAGLVGSYSIVYNPALRDRIRQQASTSHYNSMNVLSMHALLGAYTSEGEEWVRELRQVLTENADFAVHFIEEHFPGVTVTHPQGTYMLWLDCSGWCEAHGQSITDLQRAGWRVGVAWQDGEAFKGKNCIRMNLALPLSRVQEAFERLQKYVFK